jgi:hypothetical protein
MAPVPAPWAAPLPAEVWQPATATASDTMASSRAIARMEAVVPVIDMSISF